MTTMSGTTSDAASVTECGLRRTMEQLRQEQSALERQYAAEEALYATDSNPYTAIETNSTTTGNGGDNNTNRRCVRPLTSDAQRQAMNRPTARRNVQTCKNINMCVTRDSGSSCEDTPGTVDAGSLRARLRELDALKRRYQRSADRAMRHYLRSVSDTPRYQAEREARLRSARPFSFEQREKMRPAGITETRIAADRLEREAALEAELHTSFTASAVPPTTFMNKYDLMVEEWKERRAAQRLVARRKAERMKAEAAFVRLSADAMGELREELRGPQRARSAEPHTRRQSTIAARSVTEIPLEVQLKLWPAVKEYEQVRKERIKSIAAVKKAAVEANVRKVMPLLSSTSPREHQRLAGFGDIAVHTAALAGTNGVYGIGAPLPQEQQQVQTQQQVQAQQTQQATTAPNAAAAVMPGALREPDDVKRFLAALATLANTPATTTTTTTTTTTDVATAATRPATAPHQTLPAQGSTSRTTSADKRKHPCEDDTNKKALLFKPRVTPGVPDFQRLWAQERVAMLERRKRRPPTVPKPFDLTPSPRAEVIRGRRYIRPASQPLPPLLRIRTRTRSLSQVKKSATSNNAASSVTPTTLPITTTDAARQQAQDEANGTTNATTTKAEVTTQPEAGDNTTIAKENKTPGTATTTSVPKGTRAHALRTELVYAKYIHQASLQERYGSAAAAEEKAALQRRRAAARRVAPYLRSESAHVAHEKAIADKVKELRAAMHEAEKAAAERLTEMKARVARMPPVFVEPEHLDTLAAARTETEQEILRILHETGLTRQTIQQILSRPSSARDKGKAESIVGEEEGDAAEKTTKEEESKAGEAKAEEKKDEESGKTKEEGATAAPLPVPVALVPTAPTTTTTTVIAPVVVPVIAPPPQQAAVHHSDSDSSASASSSSSSSTTSNQKASTGKEATSKEPEYEDSFESDSTSSSSSSSSSSAHSL